MQQGGTALPANEHVLRIIWPFLPVVLALALFCLASVDMLSAARGFVAGESLWSKGQKDAVMHLLRYADARDPADFDAYRAAIAVPLGDRQARLELEKRPDFNRQVAVEGLLIGGNHHDDIPGMIRLYRYFRNVTEIDRAIAVWAAADVDIAHLTVVANHLRECVGTPAEPACLPPLQREIAELDARLGPMAMAFSAALGQASRRVRGVLLSGTVLLTILLLGCASCCRCAPSARSASCAPRWPRASSGCNWLWRAATMASGTGIPTMANSISRRAAPRCSALAPTSCRTHAKPCWR